MYFVESLVSAKSDKVHPSRLLHYTEAGREIDQIHEDLDNAERSKEAYGVIDEIFDICEELDGVFLGLKWEGQPDEVDFT